MLNTLEIGKYIHNILSSNAELQKLGVKDYPLIADNDAKFPFIVYKRNGLVSLVSKDGIYQDNVTIEIKIVSDKYATGVEIANIVRKLIQRPYAVFGDIEIDDVAINFANEDFTENAYIQTMQFILKIQYN